MIDGNVLDWGRPEGTVTLMLRSTTPSSRILVILISMLPPGNAEARGYHAGAWGTSECEAALTVALNSATTSSSRVEAIAWWLYCKNINLLSFPRSRVGTHSLGVTTLERGNQ